MRIFKRICFILSLVLINGSPFVVIIGYQNNILIHNYCAFGFGYTLSFVLMYFADTPAVIWCVLISILLFLALMNFFIIFSYIKKKWVYIIAIGVCFIDGFLGIMCQRYVIALMDLILSAVIFTSMLHKKTGGERQGTVPCLD